MSDNLKESILAHAYARAMDTLVAVMTALGAPGETMKALENGDHEHVCWWVDQHAALIAAAPDLLAALKTALPTLDDAAEDTLGKAQESGPESAAKWLHVSECYKADAAKARAAIAKAEGRTV